MFLYCYFCVMHYRITQHKSKSQNSTVCTNWFTSA